MIPLYMLYIKLHGDSIQPLTTPCDIPKWFCHSVVSLSLITYINTYFHVSQNMTDILRKIDVGCICIYSQTLLFQSTIPVLHLVCSYMCDGTRKLHLLYSRVWSTVPCIQLRCYCHMHSLSLVHRHSVQVAGKIRPGVLCAATRVQLWMRACRGM